METFWLVWRENGGTPMVKHESVESAMREATRLTMKYGEPFIVLRAVGRCHRTPPVQWERAADSYINECPF